jgi:hypothetical protein
MKKGVLIYAHNSRFLDYALMSLIAGSLAIKHLNVPASLVTDATTLEWMKESNILIKASSIFENIIIVDRPITDNKRRLFDGMKEATVPFVNSNRHSAYEVTPYDRTLLIDSDYFIFSNKLSEYWNVENDIMIGESINDISPDNRLGFNDIYVSEVGVKLYWATTVMFSKTETSKLFFDTVELIKENYKYYADIYRFDNRQFRNDIAFSIAKHILDGFTQSAFGKLPPVLTALDKDVLANVDTTKLTFLIADQQEKYVPAVISNTDIHIMNKQSIIRYANELMELT